MKPISNNNSNLVLSDSWKLKFNKYLIYFVNMFAIFICFISHKIQMAKKTVH